MSSNYKTDNFALYQNSYIQDDIYRCMKLRREHQIIGNIECKYCTKCNTFVDVRIFAKNKKTWDGLYAFCLTCKRKRAAIYYEDNAETIINKSISYAQEHKYKVKQYQQEYKQLNAKELKQDRKVWERNNQETIKEYNKLYKRDRRQETEYRLLENLRNRLGRAAKGSKSDKTTDLIGCDISTLKTHLECLFKDGMTWDNYGKWHIDHIIPCSSFDLSIEEEQRRCFHYTNLQPLWAIDNIKKGTKQLIPVE